MAIILVGVDDCDVKFQSAYARKKSMSLDISGSGAISIGTVLFKVWVFFMLVVSLIRVRQFTDLILGGL